MQKIQGYSEKGNTFVTVAGVTATTKPVQGSFPLCTITIYDAGTANLATLYADDAAPPTAKANPFTAASDGSWFAYIANGRYDVRFSGTGITTPFTIGDIPAGVGAGGVPSYAFASLPTSKTQNAGDIARVTNSVGGLWMDSGDHWSPIYPVVNAFEMTGANMGAKIVAAIARVPATGGVVDARAFEGAQTISVDIWSGVAKPVLLLFGAATITVSATQNIPSNCGISGQKSATVFTSALSNASIFNLNSATNSFMRDFIVTGPGWSAASNGTNIRLTGCTTCLIEDVELRYYQRWGILGTACVGCRVVGVKSTLQTSMAGVTDGGNTVDVFFADSSFDNIVEDCYLTGPSDIGIAFTQLFDTAQLVQRNKAVNNIVQNKYLIGILSYSGGSFGTTGYNIIQGNHVKTVYGRDTGAVPGSAIDGMGIYCSNTKFDIVDANTVEDTVKSTTSLINQVAAISVFGEKITITSNIINTSGHDGISAVHASVGSGDDGLIVSDNQVLNCLRYGFLFQDIVGITANGNRARACGSVALNGNGLIFFGCTNVVVSGHSSDTSQVYGIQFLNCNNVVGVGLLSHSNKAAGVYVAGCNKISLSTLIVYNNSFGAAGVYTGFQADTTTYLTLKDVTAYDTQGTPTQKYGVELQATVTSVVYAGTSGVGNVTALENILTNSFLAASISGTYTPVHSALVNLSATTPFVTMFTRNGNIVTVSGKFNADPVAGTTLTTFEMTLPIASNIADSINVSGQAVDLSEGGNTAGIYGVIANDTAIVQWTSTASVNNHEWEFTFMYRIL